MANEEENFLPLSALQHLIFCSRQCALIYLEQVWEENLYTAEGRVLHDKAHRGGAESRRDVRVATAVRLASHKLRLSGQADILEFHRSNEAYDGDGRLVSLSLPGVGGLWRPFPVEYKRGKPKAHRADEVQLCAQAMCLEEMLRVHISEGALFYGITRRRQEVVFTDALRGLTADTSVRLHELLSAGITPKAKYEKKKCNSCSLLESCRPQTAERESVAHYIKRMVCGENEKTT